MKYLSNVTTLKLDDKKCIGCGMCEIVCPHAVFSIEGGKALISDRDACMECGACSKNCPVCALSVNSGVGCATGIINGVLGGGECCGSKDCSCS
ncbi:MAG: mercury methylation ferredoxin HgcB [Kiritimatiellae bacterium]|nr:mercury methylation ferredoxin HgcB [Kiritimatiellia bacterium]MDD5520191.1 mercury methylation ferredoxin HgcB [Kiritimatiellia bacterium]